jgi:hypothetical protein
MCPAKNNKKKGTLQAWKLSNGVAAEFSPDCKLKSTFRLNWFQVCIEDSHPPLDIAKRVVSVPYIDPIPGGFALEDAPDYTYYSDNTPWYWDTETINVTTKGEYNPANTLTSNSDGTRLYFIDMPEIKPNSSIKFKTWLVALNQDNTFKCAIGGFQWGMCKDCDGYITVNLIMSIDEIPDRYLVDYI